MKRIKVKKSKIEVKNKEQTEIKQKRRNKKNIKMLKENQIKGQKGITLLVLVIAIIVLLILAGITIRAITGEGGIIKNATTAKERTEIANERKIVEEATIRAMGNNKYGYIENEELQAELDNLTEEGKTTIKIIRNKRIVEFTNSLRMYQVDDRGNIFEYTYTKVPIMENGSIFNNRMNDYKSSILTVTVLDKIDIPENPYKVFDVSKNQDETVKAWLVTNSENTDMYDLYIGGEEGLEIEDCSYMFSGFSECTSINIENLYTEKVENFYSMFTGDSKLIDIIAPNLVNSKATNLMYMFYMCMKLKSIDTSNWDTSNVTNMFGTFRMCQTIESLDLSNWNTSNVTDTSYLFQYCQKLKTIYVSDKWNNDKVTNSENMFQGCLSLKGAINFDSTKITITYANYTNGYFTFKGLE